MIRSWVSSQYLGHKSLKEGFDIIKRSLENVAITSPNFQDHTDTTDTGVGIGGFVVNADTFVYRINDATYIKGSGAQIGTLIPHDTTDNTASGGYDVTAKYYRAGALMINASGNFSMILADNEVDEADGGRAKALGYLMDKLAVSDFTDKAIVAFYIVGNYDDAFVSTTTLRLGTALTGSTSSFRIYSFGGSTFANTPTAPAVAGVSYDGAQLLGLL
jgi:hypothetical protein